jgi:hypothetical protein
VLSAIAVTTCITALNPGYWAQLLLFAAPIYLVFIGYPFLLDVAPAILYPYLACPASPFSSRQDTPSFRQDGERLEPCRWLRRCCLPARCGF